MFEPQPVTLRLEPLSEADLQGLLALAEANRESQQYMSGSSRPAAGTRSNTLPWRMNCALEPDRKRSRSSTAHAGSAAVTVGPIY